MEYRNLGKAGIKLSELSLGSWITFGGSLDLDGVRQCIRVAWENGVNFFDNAEVYANGVAEMLMGEILKDYKRESLVLSTKIFWGGQGPNEKGLSWKHLVEGTRHSLRRLGCDYVDLLFCHRPDPQTPIEETVRAMDYIIRSGMAFYWGTSEWAANQIEEAQTIARQINAIPPSMEQPEYNLFERKKVEVEFAPLYAKYGLGTTIWSPLASGLLTGKYNEGIPSGSRLANNYQLRSYLKPERIAVVKELESLSKELNCTTAQLSIAWCLKNPHVSSVILGASHPQQLQDNLRSIEVKEKLSQEVMTKIDRILQVHQTS
jgi:voltage-dependent potassium channel beta subunit